MELDTVRAQPGIRHGGIMRGSEDWASASRR